MSDALRHIAIEFHALHSHAPYNIQTFNNCEHNICIEARQALAAAPPAVHERKKELSQEDIDWMNAPLGPVPPVVQQEGMPVMDLAALRATAALCEEAYQHGKQEGIEAEHATVLGRLKSFREQVGFAESVRDNPSLDTQAHELAKEYLRIVEAEREANAKRLEELEARWRKHVQGIFNNEESDPIGDELVYADVKKACARELKQLAAATRSNSQGKGRH